MCSSMFLLFISTPSIVPCMYPQVNDDRGACIVSVTGGCYFSRVNKPLMYVHTVDDTIGLLHFPIVLAVGSSGRYCLYVVVDHP